MGFYINPEGQTKEEFLAKHGKPLTDKQLKEFDFKSEELPVCFVDNGWMTAAAIAYDGLERDRFSRPDERPKQWFAVSKEKLKPFLPVQALQA